VTGAAGKALADAVRALIEQIAARTAPDPDLEAAAAAVRAVTERLRAAGDPRVLSFDGGGDPWTYLRLSPISGGLNPLAPPVRVELTEDGAVEGRVSFGFAYQGPPGYVHGAFIAAVFDELMGAANTVSGNPGMTVRLEVRYRRPTPLRTALRVAVRHTGRQGRRIFAAGTMFAGDQVTAEAEGTFAEITVERAAELFGTVLRARDTRDGDGFEEGEP
jgi:acyl-coenzyme A thioesterase PaaI-like protein